MACFFICKGGIEGILKITQKNNQKNKKDDKKC